MQIKGEIPNGCGLTVNGVTGLRVVVLLVVGGRVVALVVGGGLGALLGGSTGASYAGSCSFGASVASAITARSPQGLIF